MSQSTAVDEKKNSVILTSNLFSPHIGGVENSLLYLAKAYQEMGYEPRILTSNIPRAGQAPLALSESVNGTAVERYEAQGKGMAPTVIRSFNNALKLYRRHSETNNARLFVCRYHYNQLIASLAGAKPTVYLVPGVIKFQNAPKYQQSAGLRYRLRWYYHHFMQLAALKRATHVAVFSKNMAAQLRQIGFKGTIHLTKPGVDLERFKPLPSEEKRERRIDLGLTANPDAHVFLCVGRCVGVKGFHLAIDALATGPENGELWIVGDGADMAELKEQSRKLQLEHRIKFIGATQTTETYYSLADTFVHSSLYEPLGQTVLEALASGLPIIAFEADDATGVNTASRDLMNDSHCVFVAEPAPVSLAKAMGDMAALDQVSYESRSALNRKHAEATFSWQKLAQDLLAIANVKDLP